jgi:glycosyltransferase involved in cell wall biosynthesis
VLAQITPWKAQDDAIAITSLLRERYPQVRLVLAGSPKFVSRSTRFDNTRFMHQLRRSVSTLGLDENVLFLGERADIPQILGAIDFLLVPSTEEPFGRAMIEGMAMQVPVLATAVGGPAEVITYGDDGMLLPPRSPERWANEIATLFEAPDLARRMGERARQTVLERFTAARHSEQVLDVYRRVLTTQRSFRREQQMAGASGL